LVFGLTLLALLAASSCGTGPPRTPTVTPTLTVTATFPPTLTPTPEPLGTASNPFVIGLVSETADPQIAAAADELARQVALLGQVSVVGRVYPTYNQLLESMARGEVHAAWMYPLTYLYASERGIARVTILTNHFGVYAYGTQIMANVESGFTPYYDPISGLSSADAATALEQFRDLRPCWVEPQSVSGYVLPAGILRGSGITFQPGVISQTHTAVVRSLYIKGVCDFGATFSISGDPRTASAVIDDLPDVMNRIMIIWRSDAAVPNLSLALLASLSEGERQTLTRAFLELGRSPEGRALLSLSANDYQIDDVKAIDDDAYAQLRAAATALNMDLSAAVGK
jgi:phosphonate transport system substrate-binding protein